VQPVQPVPTWWYHKLVVNHVTKLMHGSDNAGHYYYRPKLIVTILLILDKYGGGNYW